MNGIKKKEFANVFELVQGEKEESPIDDLTDELAELESDRDYYQSMYNEIWEEKSEQESQIDKLQEQLDKFREIHDLMDKGAFTWETFEEMVKEIL